MNIYLSHARKDHELARDLAKRLTSRGFRIWNPEFDIEPGENWAKKTGEALDAADFMVFLLTSGALDSDIVHRDFSYAIMGQEFAHRVFTVYVGPMKGLAKDVPWILWKQPHRRVSSAKEFGIVAKEIQELCASIAHA